MQYLVSFSPKKKLETEGMPADFAEQETQEQAQTRVLYAGGGLRQVWPTWMGKRLKSKRRKYSAPSVSLRRSRRTTCRK